MPRRATVLLLAGCAGLAGCTGDPSTPTAPAAQTVQSPTAPARTLDGATIVIDPGHQVGNVNFPRRTSRPVPAGGFTKGCNSTGTATDAGFPEATFNHRVAQRLRRQLERAGARVLMTRTQNRADLWGPCIDERGRLGNRVADLKVSIHGDGSYTDGRGFHVIAPTDRAPWTDDIYRSSRLLARAVKQGLVRTGFAPADYVAGGDGLDFRADLAMLNLSDIPTVVVEAGNMRNRAEARVMSSARGQYRYARGLLRGIRLFLSR